MHEVENYFLKAGQQQCTLTSTPTHLGQTLSPRQQIGVVLERPHEHDPALQRVHHLEQARLEEVGRREADAFLQLLERARGAAAAEEERLVVGGAQAPLHKLAGVAHRPGGDLPHMAVLGVGVAWSWSVGQLALHMTFQSNFKPDNLGQAAAIANYKLQNFASLHPHSRASFQEFM